MYLTLHAVFITGNDFYFYNNDYSISTVSPGTNDMGISVSASLATNAFCKVLLLPQLPLLLLALQVKL